MLTQQQLVQHQELKENLIAQLKKQGFMIGDDGYLRFEYYSKESIRKLHSIAVAHLLEKKNDFIVKNDQNFVEKYVANGNEIKPENIEPSLLTVDERNTDVFNWIKLHWSIPVSSGYGRRLRYIVEDKQNKKIIGIIGLGDPVYALRDRESFIGWTREMKSRKLKNLMDAFVLGSIPPYNYILGGKLVASLVSSNEIFNDFKNKYSGKKSLIKEDIFDGTLAGVTTSSALGKSAIYDRLKVKNGTEFQHVGWTSGSGDFQFLNGYYDLLTELVKEQKYTGKNKKWGTGIRSRRTVIHKSLSLLGLSPKFAYHGIKRELFFVPTGKNSKEFLCEQSTSLDPYGLTVKEISDYIKERWVIPRAKRVSEYREFNRNHYSLLSSII